MARCHRGRKDGGGRTADDGRRDIVDHSLPELLRQRIYGLALGDEDLNDHEHLRRDPLLATACDKADPQGQDRFNPQDRGVALAAPSTLNRLELSNKKTTRCHKLPHDPVKIEACLLAMGVRCLPKHAKEVVIDLDSMGHLVHGLQEGRHFSGYYGDYCYLGCHGTQLARATAGTIRLKLLQVAAQVTVSVRRVYIQLSSAHPAQELFRLCHARLMGLAQADR